MDKDPVKSASWMNVHHFSQSLLDLLQITQTNRKTFLQSANNSSREPVQLMEMKSLTSPISLATQLVSSATVLYKECNFSEEFMQNLNSRNIKILLKFSPNDERFDAKQLDDARILILRVLLGVCHACCDERSDLEELFGKESMCNLLDTIKGILDKHGSKVGQDTSPSAFMENIHKDPFLEALGEDIDQFFLRQLFLRETLLKIFDAIVSAIDPTDADAHEVTRLVGLLREFQCSGGYHILTICVQSLVQKITFTCGNSLSLADVNGPLCQEDSQFSLLEQKLKPVFEAFANTCKLVKLLKTNYLHGIKCRKRCHHHCDLSILLHQHHDILGIAVSRYESFEAVTTPIVHKIRSYAKGGSYRISEDGNSVKKSSKKMTKAFEASEIPSSCVIGTAVNFLIQNIFPISPICVGFVLSALDTVGICHCIQPHGFVVPLLSSMQRLDLAHQDNLLATVGRGLLQRMDASSQEERCVSDRDTNNITCMPSYELPSDYPTLIVPCQKTVSFGINPIDKIDDSDTTVTSTNHDNTIGRLPNFSMILDKTDLPRWLCLACYKDLLLIDFVPQTDELEFPSGAYKEATLSDKVSKHLASFATYFDEESLCVLLTTAILPVLHFVSKKLNGDGGSTALCGENDSREVNFMQQRISLLAIRPFTSIILNLLKVLSIGLAEKEQFRKIFIRHSGVELLCNFLLPLLHQCDSRTGQYNTIDIDGDCEKIYDVAAICIKLIIRNASNLTMADKIMISPKHKSDNTAGNASNSSRKGEVSDHNEPVTFLGRIVRGIRKSPKVQQQDSSKHSISEIISSQSTPNHVTLKSETVDERKVFHFDCCKVLSTVLKTLCKMTNSEEDAYSLKSDEEFENTNDIEPIDECGATSSKSSGYQSKSRKSSSGASNATNIEVDLLHLSYEHKSTSLHDYHVFQMDRVLKMCSLISIVIQDNEVALREFCNLNGPKVFLRILLSTAISLDSVKKNSDVTQTVSESPSENDSYESLNTHTKDLLEETKSSQSLDASKLKSAYSNDSKKLPDVTSPDIKQERKVERKDAEESGRDVWNILDLKLKILSSSLSVTLLYSKKNCDSEFSPEDIISMLKPPIQRSHLMCTKYCESLCKALFESSVEARVPVVERSRQKRSSIINEVKETNFSPAYDHENSSDGYQGDTESNSGEDSAFSLFSPNVMEKVPKPLIDCGIVINPELIELITQLLGDARKDLLSFDNSDESSLLLPSLPLLSLEQCSDNIRSALSTAASLIQFSQKNFETMLNNSDLPLVFMESLSDILENDCMKEQDIRQSILELCLMFNMEHMSAEHLRLVLSFFNSVHPPMEQLLKFLLVLINNLYAGPGHCLQFPVEGKSIDCLRDDLHHEQSRDAAEAYSLSVWKIAPLRLPINGNVRWPTTNVGLTISLWLQVGSFGYLNKWKSDIWRSYSDTVPDIDHESQFHRHGSVDFDPYHHLVSIGTKQSMLQIWLEGGTLIFRICVDAHDGNPVGVLAQTECPGLVSLNGEWQHITFTYTENQLPDKTVLGKVHAIVNCTSETDILLEHMAPSSNKGITSRKNSDHLTLFVGHWIRPDQTKFSLQDSSGYQLGTVMIFDGIHFTMRSAFAIYRQGPDISNLTECLETTDEETSSVAVSAKVRLSRSLNFHVNPIGSPTSPARSFGFGSYKQFFPLPHSFLVSDLASEEFFTDRTLPNSISLQEHLVLSYCPTDPTIYLCNPIFAKPVESKKRSLSFSFFSSTSSNAPNSTEEFDPLNFQSLQMQVEQLVTIVPFQNMGLQRSLTQVGGVPVFLMLCAKVIEITAEGLDQSKSLMEHHQAELIQSYALRTLLDLRRADTKRREEFFSQNITAMLHKLLTKPQALVGFHALQIIFNAACSGDDVILNHGDDHFEIKEENSALLHDHELIQVFLTDWKIWHKSVNFSNPRDPCDNFLVWNLLLDGLLNLVGVNHPHQYHNCKMLMQVGIVENILKGLQKLIFDDVKPFPTRIVTSKFIELLRVLAGSPPDVSILSKICDFLVAIHPPASTFVCHSPASFYFNLRSLKVPTSRSLSLTNAAMQTQPEGRSLEMVSHSVEQLPMHMTAVSQIVADHSVSPQQELFQVNMGKETTHSASKDKLPSCVDSTRCEDNSTGSNKSESKADSSWEDLPHAVSSTVATPTASEFSSFKKEDHSEFHTNIAQSSFAEGADAMHSFHSVDDTQYAEFEDEISHVIAELLDLLFVAVRIMPDMDAFELTNGPLSAKCLIVGIHHKSGDVRAGMIKLLAAYFSRCSKKTQDEFLQEKGFHLVANQIHQHIVTRPIVESCLYFLFGHLTSSTEPLPFDGTGTDSGMLAAPDTFSNHAVILLLATLTQTTHDAELCQDMVARLQELFENIGPAADIMLDNGLTLALCNLLFEILSPSCLLLKDEKKAVLKEIQHFMTCIAIKACVTAGSAHFQVSEDLFTLLHKVESEFVCDANVDGQEASAQIRSISFDIILTVMEAMQKSSNGKSLLIQKNSPNFDNGLSQIDRSTHTSKETLSATTGTHVRRASGSVAVHSQKTAMTRRSISSASGLPGSSESFRSHRGNLRTRSYRGSQRRRINEAETARRLQRLVIIAVDKIVNYYEQAREQVEGGISESARSSINTENVEAKLFNILVEWIESTLPVTNTCHGVRRGSRYGNLLNGNDFVKAWKRILNISRDSIIDQILRLIINFMSPKQKNRQIKYQPLFISQRSTAERMLSTLFPRDSKFLKKIGVCLDHVIISCKSEMNSEEKKALKDFCKIFQRCGGVIYRTSLSSQTLKPDIVIGIDATNEIEKLQNLMDGESIRELRLWNEKNRDAFDQLRLRTDHLSSAVTQRAMDITQKVVLRQNIERKKMNAYEREVISNDLCVRNQWSCLLEQLAHERAVFYDEKRYPKSWQLDATEGPHRERRRMQRCHLNIADRFFLRKGKDHEDRETERKLLLDEKVRRMVSGEEDSPVHQQGNGKMISTESSLHDKRPLSFLFDDEYQSSDSNTIRVRLQTNEKISIVQNCTNVTASSETPGELMIGESSMYFVGDETISDLSLTQALFGECKVLLLSWRHEEVMEIHNRWWQLQDTAIEVFLTNGKTYLLAFVSQTDRDMMVKRLRELDLPNLVTSDNNLDTITQIWQSGKMTNFEYLTQLNKSAGRSFNDLMQYPVMPFILADYTSAILDLSNVETFRNLLRPISVPDDARMKHYQDRYRNLADDYKNCPQDERELGTQPCHYGSHYSNSGTVLHFLVRLPPYTQMFLDYQDSSFDIPDRTFHSMETTFRLSCYSSTTDVKELIPEFFFLPEFLCNSEGFDLGLRQCGLRVNHVSLPPWSKMDPRLFILIHRQVLESDYVSANLHGWIDLVFGYKQTGKAAIEAVNVFHPATYFGVDVNSVEDPVARKALKTMIKTYGQTPKQLFAHPHPPKSTKSIMKNQTPQGKVYDEPQRSTSVSAMQSVQDTQPLSSNRDIASHMEASLPQRPISSALGLKWGKYLGSPCTPEPVPFLIKKLSDHVGSLVPLQTNDVCVLSPRMSLLVKYHRGHRVKSSQNIDVRWSAVLTYGYPDNIIRLMTKKSLPEINLMCTPAYDKVTCSVVGSDCQVILLGHSSGAVVATKCNAVYDEPYDLEIRKGRTLYGHYAEVTCLVCCGEFRILASGSKDGTAILWDLDALTYIRSLTGHATAVSSMAISKTSGDICTVCDSGNNDGSHIRLWTINGSLVAAQDTKDRVNCVTFSSAPEGVSVNVLAAGMSNGVIRLWSSWDLMWIRDIVIDGLQSPVMSLTYTQDGESVYAATSEGKVIGLCHRDKLEDKHPLLISFLKVEGARVS